MILDGLTVRVIDFSSTGEKSRQHFFKEFERIIKLFKNTNCEKVVLNIVHSLHHSLFRDFILSRARIAWERVAAEKLDVFPRDRLHALGVVLFYALVDSLELNLGIKKAEKLTLCLSSSLPLKLPLSSSFLVQPNRSK